MARYGLVVGLARFGTTEGLNHVVDQTVRERARKAEAAGETRCGLAVVVVLLSLLDVMMQQPMEKVLESIGLTEESRDALLHRSGPWHELLELARCLETGQLGRRNLQQAHDWYELAAESGAAEAQLAMGTAHYLGRGRPKDALRAAHWYREAAEAGDVGAAYILASMYERGDGVDRDLRLARYWYERAAAGGDEAAPYKVRELELRESAS